MGLSGGGERSVSRPAKSRPPAGSLAGARQNSRTRPGPAASPSSRSVRANAVRRSTSSATEQLGLCALEILVVLQCPAERLTRGVPVRAYGAEQRQRASPVDRLRNTRGFDE